MPTSISDRATAETVFLLNAVCHDAFNAMCTCINHHGTQQNENKPCTGTGIIDHTTTDPINMENPNGQDTFSPSPMNRE